MTSAVLSFYLTFIIILCCIWYAGLEQTLILVDYVVKRVQLIYIEWRLGMMKRRLEKELKATLDKYK